MLILMLHSVPHLGPRGIARLLSEIGSPGDGDLDLDALEFWNSPPDVLRGKYRLHQEAANCLACEKPKLMQTGAELLDAVTAMKIRVMTSVDPDYPLSLLDMAGNPPTILYAYGNLGLLRERKYAVVGSSSVSPDGLEVIREFAGILSEEGLVAVTSHNTEPYQVAGVAAKSRNAPIVLVLDRGILSAFPRGLRWEPIPQARIWDVRFDPERDLAISAFRLYDAWIGANARERDKTVFSLADVLIAVDVRGGGVMEKECARAHEAGREVYVHAPDSTMLSDGSNALIQLGCTPIKGSDAVSLLHTLDLFHEPVGSLFEDGLVQEGSEKQWNV